MSDPRKNSTLRKLVAAFGILLGVVYIINPGAGFFELLPDNLPFIGNLDEAAAVWMILRCLREFGIDLTNFGGASKEVEKEVEKKK